MRLETWPDSAFPPADHRQALAVLRAMGATGWAMYPDVGLPYHAWPEPTMAAVLAEAHGALLIAAPAQGAAIADAGVGAHLAAQLLAVARALGLRAPVLALDVEAGTYQAFPDESVAAVADFSATAQEGGGYAAPYGPPGLAVQVAGLRHGRPDRIWPALWPGLTRTPDPRSIPGIPDALFSRGQRAWQWRGGTAVAGMTVDENVSDFALARVTDAPRPAAPARASAALTLAGRRLLVTVEEA